VGAGAFWGGASGLNEGSYASYGGFLGGPNFAFNPKEQRSIELVPSKGYDQVWGIGAGVGAGLFITNATCVADLKGPFEVLNVGVAFLSFQYATGGGTWQVSLGVAKSIGFSISEYATNTVPIDSTAPSAK
jgi:hypothetical protein